MWSLWNQGIKEFHQVKRGKVDIHIRNRVVNPLIRIPFEGFLCQTLKIWSILMSTLPILYYVISAISRNSINVNVINFTWVRKIPALLIQLTPLKPSQILESRELVWIPGTLQSIPGVLPQDNQSNDPTNYVARSSLLSLHTTTFPDVTKNTW